MLRSVFPAMEHFSTQSRCPYVSRAHFVEHSCAEKRKRAKPLEALHTTRTTPPRDPKTARSTLRPPCNVRHGMHPGVPSVSTPYPCSASVGFLSSGSPFPRPQHPAHRFTASRQSLSSLSYSHPRATLLFRLPAASSRFPLHPSASARLFLRAASHALRPFRIDRSSGKGMPTMNK